MFPLFNSIHTQYWVNSSSEIM